MKVVLDTNVVVSGLLTKKGSCAEILRLALGGHLDLCVDGRILREYEAVLPRARFRILPEEVHHALNLLRFRAERSIPLPLRVELPDSSDLPFLEVAAAASAILITGNTRHFPRDRRAGVTVMAPTEFLDFLGGST